MSHDPDNSDRAAWAENAVNVFGEETYCGRNFTNTVIEQPDEGDDAYTMCQDLISDILHLARKQGWDTERMLRNAVQCFRRESRRGVGRMSIFDLSKPAVGVRASSFGGGWAWPLDAAGSQALREFFGEAPTELAPLGGLVGYIVEPFQSGDLAEHLRSCNCAWEIQ